MLSDAAQEPEKQIRGRTSSKDEYLLKYRMSELHNVWQLSLSNKRVQCT